MKNLIVLIGFLLSSLYLQAQIVNIPDANFKNALLDHVPPIDTNNDNEIQVSEAEIVPSLYVNGENISSLEGIQYFSSLWTLSCYDNELTSINLIDNTELRILECYNNNLSSLDLSSNIELQLLRCNDNFITYLDLHQNVNLEFLYCFRNELTNLNIGSNSQINLISASYNQLINLDVSQCPWLEFLFCYNNSLENLNVQNNNSEYLIGMFSYDNPNLTCIQVDDVVYANNMDCNLPNTGWCKDSWTEYSEDCDLGIEGINLSAKYIIYPNPVNNIIIIDNITTKEITSINIFDVSGKLAMSVESDYNQIDISGLNSGLLFVEIETDLGVVTKKIIKD